MKRKNYIFTNRKHSERAIMSTILGLISNASMGIVLYLSYRNGGNVPASYGLTGLLATLFSLIGLIMGLFTMREKDTFKLFPGLGIFLNMVALIILMFLVQLSF
ncbi:MAG: DUF6142 family protein [Clostridium sp.]|nr:DUF6142 family protein [Acetatifactor muris]MCM1526154.1 DUF6142 family protein [Bacteroides sp.]MCM1562698.1 DUF6142 family protein [Clostridium sp.]